jgi:hypothetical protein
MPAKAAPAVTEDADLAEATDLTPIPQPPLVGEAQRATSLGVAVMTAVPLDGKPEDSAKLLTAPEPEPPPVDAAAVATTSRSGGMRASQIMAAIPASDDWTMTPDAAAPTVVAAADKPASAELLIAAPRAPTGDWLIANDPEAGWSAPSKPDLVAKPEPAPPAPKPRTPAKGNVVAAVASEHGIQAQVWEDKPTGIGEAKIEIDPTLMEPLKPMPLVDEDGFPQTQPARIPTPVPGAAMSTPVMHAFTPPPALSVGFAPAPLASPPLPPPPLTPLPGQFGTTTQGLPPPPAMTPHAQAAMMGFDQPRMVTDQGTGFFRDSGSVPHYATDAQAAIRQGSSKRTLVIAVSAAVIAVMGFVIVVMATGGKKSRAAHPTGSGAAPIEVASGSAPGPGETPGSGSALPTIAPPDRGSDVTQVAPPVQDAGAGAAATCTVAVTTTPAGAEVSLDKTVLGTTPGTFALPCGVEAKLGIRKRTYMGVYKLVTPTAEGATLAVKLAAALFSVKVTSVPAGATITVGGKPMGVTPTTIKVPAYAASSITISKDGFAPDTQKLTVKDNNVAHHVTLKKTGKRR